MPRTTVELSDDAEEYLPELMQVHGTKTNALNEAVIAAGKELRRRQAALRWIDENCDFTDEQIRRSEEMFRRQGIIG